MAGQRHSNQVDDQHVNSSGLRTAPAPQGLPVLPVDSSFAHAVVITPVRPVGCYRISRPTGIGLPQRIDWVGSHITSFEACSTFTRVTACTLADSLKEPSPEVLQSGSLPPQTASGATGRSDP